MIKHIYACLQVISFYLTSFMGFSVYYVNYALQCPDQLWGPTQPPIQWVLEPPSPGIKQPARKADHSP
jgi:hypothetical protein